MLASGLSPLFSVIHNAVSRRVLGLIFIAEEKAGVITPISARATPGMWGPGPPDATASLFKRYKPIFFKGLCLVLHFFFVVGVETPQVFLPY